MIWLDITNRSIIKKYIVSEGDIEVDASRSLDIRDICGGRTKLKKTDIC